MRREDWPQRLAQYVRARDEELNGPAWVAGWLAECGGRHGSEVDWRIAQRGDLVEFAGGVLAVCVGRHAVPSTGPMREMADAVRAWRVV